MKYLNEYNSIMSRYRAGEFGADSLSLYDILERANAAGLMEKMDLSEIQRLLDLSSGITKRMFSLIKQREEKRIIDMDGLEQELKNFSIDSYRSRGDHMDETLARNLGLVVQYCENDELPIDTEAMLCPIDDDTFNGVIKIKKDCATSKFSFRHELIHYFRDVKVGNKVTSAFARKEKGKTPNDEEQDVNYLTAASIMPFDSISARLDEFEAATTQESEKQLLSSIASEYEQDEDAVLRRLVEVRRLADYEHRMMV